MRTGSLLALILAFGLLPDRALADAPPMSDVARAHRYFLEAEWACQDDGGRLWGKSLEGPMIFVEPGTRRYFANRRTPDPSAEEVQSVFTGTLPAGIGIANTSFDWSDTAWTMVMWPLPANRVERVRLMVHELWHRIQADLGLPAFTPDNRHLDTLEGRLWLQLEVRALAKAYTLPPDQQLAPLADAALFRGRRQQLFAGAKQAEDRMEVHEGLAEYTGYALRGTWPPETRWSVSYLKLRPFDGQDSYSGSFAYDTGPAYGFLLDLHESVRKVEPSWRTRVRGDSSLADMLDHLLGIHVPADLERAAVEAGARYGYADLLASETQLDQQRKVKTREYTARFVNAPLLVLPLPHRNYSYDPYKVFSLGENGRVYEGGSVRDDWGELTTTDAVRISADFSSAFVPAPSGSDRTHGAGWKLTLNSGWKLVRGARKGDFTVRKD